MVSGEYALKECGDCGIQLPANEMTGVRDEVLSTTRRGNRVYKGVRGGVGFGTASSNTYRIEHKLVCPDCLEIRIERRRLERRAKFLGTLIALVLIGLLVGFAFAFFGSAKVPNPSAEPDASNDVVLPEGPSSPGDNSQLQVHQQAGDSGQAPDGQTSAESSPNTAADSSRQEPSEQAQAPAPVEGVPPESTEAESAIAAAARKAVETGETARWKADGKSGYVVVSTAQTYGDRVCRNVSATIISGRDQTQSAPHQWCQPAAGGDWAPQ